MERRSTQMVPGWPFLFLMKEKCSFPFLPSLPLGELDAESPSSRRVTRPSPEQPEAGRFSPFPLQFLQTPPPNWLPFCVSLPVLLLNAPLCSCSTAGGPPVTSHPHHFLVEGGLGRVERCYINVRHFLPCPLSCAAQLCVLWHLQNQTPAFQMFAPPGQQSWLHCVP